MTQTTETSETETITTPHVIEYDGNPLQYVNPELNTSSTPEKNTPPGETKPQEEVASLTEELPIHSSPQFAEAFSWCRKCYITPAKHHHGLTMEALQGIAAIYKGTTKGTLETINFLRIVTKGNELKIYIDGVGRVRYEKGALRTENCAGQKAALSDLLDDIEARSRIILVDNTLSENIDLNKVETTKIPKVEILSGTSLMALNQLVLEGDRDSKQRLKSLADRVNDNAVSTKPLAVVSNSVSKITTLDAIEPDRFPNFHEFFHYLKSQFTLSTYGDSVFRLPPILLIGDPGIGKTEVLLRLSKVLETDFLSYNMATSQSGSPLCGSDAFWANSKQGALFDLIVFGKTANPIVFLDELDKTPSVQYNPLGPLYSLLERQSATQFMDLSLPGVTLDASHVVWFAAANDVRSIDPVLLSRFKVINIPSPTREQMPVIVKSVYSALLARESWGRTFAPELSKDVLHLFKDITPRQVRKIVESACANAVLDGRQYICAKDIDISTEKSNFGFA